MKFNFSTEVAFNRSRVVAERLAKVCLIAAVLCAASHAAYAVSDVSANELTGDPNSTEETQNNLNGRRPVAIVQTSRSNTIYDGPPAHSFWGHTTAYGLKVVDNLGGLYGLGKVTEVFQNYSPAALYAADLANAGNPGTPNSTTTAVSQFGDTNQSTTSGWINNRDTGVNTLWYTLGQRFDVTRVSDNFLFTGVDYHHLSHFQGYVTRSGAN